MTSLPRPLGVCWMETFAPSFSPSSRVSCATFGNAARMKVHRQSYEVLEEARGLTAVPALQGGRNAQLVFTANSDTPYGPLQLDLTDGPLVVDLQPGPLIVCALDVNQRWVADMGLPGPDAGKGGKHLLVGPAEDTAAHAGRVAQARLSRGTSSLARTARSRAGHTLLRSVPMRYICLIASISEWPACVRS